MRLRNYNIRNTEDIITPALVYYKEGLLENAAKLIEMAGGAGNLWPHVKTHKSADMVHMLMGLGICRFKCAQLAELEMVCRAGAKAAILAYPPSGPTPVRAAKLMKAFPDTEIYYIVDCKEHIDAYAEAAEKENSKFCLLMDVNFGMNRTGSALNRAEELFAYAAGKEGVECVGFHCYDGDRHEEIEKRREIVCEADRRALQARKQLREKGYRAELIVLGGSPSFPCHVDCKEDNVFYSPGTLFINDVNYSTDFPDLDFPPAAAVMTRVVSHPAEGYFTLDCGYKGISCDGPMEKRGLLVGCGHCRPVLQNEEHYVFCMDPGYEDQAPKINEVLYLIPGHICPNAVLYPEILIAENGEITDRWKTVARDRKITF